MSSEVNPQPSSPLQSAGVVLSNERIKRGISIQEVADQIKLSRKQIEAIEADAYDRLPGPTFARGFVRNYARFLGLDPVPLLAWMDQNLPSTAVAAHPEPVAPVEPQPEMPQRPAPGSSKRGSGRLIGGLVLLAAIGAAGWALFGAIRQPSMPQAALVPSEATTEAEPAPPTEEAADPQVEAAVTEPAAPAPAEPAAAPAEPAPAPAASTPASVDTARPTTTDSAAAGIRVQARQNAWVSITDANDDKLVYVNNVITTGAYTLQTPMGVQRQEKLLSHYNTIHAMSGPNLYTQRPLDIFETLSVKQTAQWMGQGISAQSATGQVGPYTNNTVSSTVENAIPSEYLSKILTSGTTTRTTCRVIAYARSDLPSRSNRAVHTQNTNANAVTRLSVAASTLINCTGEIHSTSSSTTAAAARLRAQTNHLPSPTSACRPPTTISRGSATARSATRMTTRAGVRGKAGDEVLPEVMPEYIGFPKR